MAGSEQQIEVLMDMLTTIYSLISKYIGCLDFS
jgi:hypothetical protein